MSFVRVRGAGPNDPPHEFDVAEAELRARPFLYHVIDPVPVGGPRPVRYVSRPVAASSKKNKRVVDASEEA